MSYPRLPDRDRESTLDHHLQVISDPILDQLHRLNRSTDFVATLRRSAGLAGPASRSRAPGRLVGPLVSFAEEGTLATLLAIETLAHVRHRRADDALVGFLSRPEPVVRRHASWRLGSRRPDPRAIAPLLDQLAVGGMDTMHAHRTLRRWSLVNPPGMGGHVRARLVATDLPAQRARLVDLLGVVTGLEADEILLGIAADRAECTPARIAALGALGERPGATVNDTLHRLATDDGAIGAHAALALHSCSIAGNQLPPSRPGGLRIAQLVLAGGLDGQLSNGGRGDTGGVASLLVSLGETLAGRDDVDQVLTIGRGTVTDALTGPMTPGDVPLSYAMIAFGDDARPGDTPNEVWEHLPTIGRGIRRLLRRSGAIDLLHLRMADAGTLAGAAEARALQLPICFSLAPDPHNVVQSLQSRGELDRDSFVGLEVGSHIWFRARMVERLAREADRLALFPRFRPWDLLGDLGLDLDPLDHRAAVIAEGIDLGLVRRAEAHHRRGTAPALPPPDVIDDLAQRIAFHRRGLPLVISVGRLNPIKGMDRVVAAWAADPFLPVTCNLVIVGGDLATPSETETAVLAAIDAALPPGDPRRAGLVLLGGRPRADVAHLLAAAVRGQPGAWAGGGIYVDGALKEEFGLAVIEALAAGLVVVAPGAGGPPTYVDHGHTGILADVDADLAVAMHAAFGLVDQPGRIERARRMVEERYSIETMAAQLVELYRPAGVLL